MFLTLVTFTLACMPGEFEDAKVASANRRFTLEVTTRALALRDKGTLRWKHDAPQRQSQYRVSDSGAWVAELLFSDCIDCDQLVLFGADGSTVAHLKLLTLLSEEEQQDLGRSDCGVHWLSKATATGDALVLEIRQGGNVPPIYDQGPTVRFTVNARTGEVVRGPALPRPSIAELLEAHQKATDATARQRAFEALLAKAALGNSRGNRPLADFLLARAQSGDNPSMRARAAEALGAIGNEADLKALARGPGSGDDADLGVLAALEARDPAQAQQFALRALHEKRPPELLRERAVVLLVKDGVPFVWDAAALGLADASERVRDDTIHGLTRLPRSQRAWDLLLTVAAGSGRARIGLLQHYLDRPDDAAWRTQLNTAVTAGKLNRWGGAFVIAAAMAEVRADGAAAVALYQQGLQVLERERPKQGYFPDAELWCEAKLRLAQLAGDRNQPQEAMRLAEEVLAAGYDQTVSAPTPNRYGGGRSGSQSAQSVARQLISTKGAPQPPPFQPPNTAPMMRQMEEQVKAMKARADSANGR